MVQAGRATEVGLRGGRLYRLFGGMRGWSEVLQLPGPLRRWTLPVTRTLTAVAVLTGFAGTAILWTGRHGGGVRALVLAAGVMLAIGAAASAVLVRLGLRAFGVLHLGYLALTVTMPLVGLALAVQSAAGASSPVWSVVAGLLVLPAPIGWYATHVEPFRLVVETVTVPVPRDRTGTATVRVGVLADLQTNAVGPYEHDAVTRLLELAPDLILVPGDLFQGTHDRFAPQEDALRSLLGRLRAPHGVYFVRGDAEEWDDAGRWDYAGRALRGTGIVVLDDEVVEVAVADRRIRLGGVQLAFDGDPARRLRHRLERDDHDDGTIRILMAHRPDVVLELAPHSRVDLTVAGHTHGGQVVVPGFGPLVTLSSVPRAVARGGLHEVDGNTVYVSPGVGLERAQAPQVRFCCRPAIAVLALAAAPTGVPSPGKHNARA